MDVPAGCRPDSVKVLRSEPCPVCALPAEPRTADATVAGWRVVCPLPQGCGEFLVSMVAGAELVELTPKERKTLSRALQSAADDGEPLTLRTREDIQGAIDGVDRIEGV